MVGMTMVAYDVGRRTNERTHRQAEEEQKMLKQRLQRAEKAKGADFARTSAEVKEGMRRAKEAVQVQCTLDVFFEQAQCSRKQCTMQAGSVRRRLIVEECTLHMF